MGMVHTVGTMVLPGGHNQERGGELEPALDAIVALGGMEGSTRVARLVGRG
jgi:hypothetical protein